MKRIKRIMALVIALAMVLSLSLSAWAEDTTGAPSSGSITINSPIVGATYKVYKVFDMTTNADVDAFSYTINENSPFYGAVVQYAGTAANGLNLSRIKDSDPATYNVSVDESKFNAQNFGKAMQEVLEDGSPAVSADAAETEKAGTGIVAKEAGGAAIAETASQVCTITSDNTSDYLKFENLALGYFLVNPTYPASTGVTVTMGSQSFTADDLDEDGNLTTEAEGKITAYVNATVTDDYVNNYISENGITTNTDGSPLNTAGKAAIKQNLIDTMTIDAQNKVKAALGNDADAADINVKEPILVFLDSTQPDAVINEKNELDKWDIPVNPTGEAPDGTPDHGEPEGGKNIVVSEDPQYFADWSEAEIGESVHYQLRVNAMNFIRTGNTDDTVEQVKEYFLADYQSGHMHFDEAKGLKVTVWQGDNANDSQASTKVNVTKDATGAAVAELDYTDKSSTFFKNASDEDAATRPTDIFGDGTGIMVPWVKVVEDPSTEQLNSLKTQFPIYTITNVPIEGEYETEDAKLDANNNKIPVRVQNGENWEVVSGQFVSVNNRIVDAEGYLLDENGQKIQKTKPVYTFSLYNSDVTIVVDYWMILDDDAIVDEPGNKNYAQYGWSPIDNKDQSGKPKTPTNPSDTDKPSQKEEVDEATVYTFAIAWVKVDEKGKELADAEFELPFYVKKTKDTDAYVFAFETLPETFEQGDSADNYTNKVKTTTTSAVITIKGLEQGTYSITETEAPAGYNKLTAPFTVEAKKSGVDVTTKTKTIIYYDANGNITDTVTTATTEYNTDKDTYTNASAAGDAKDRVPVYQFDPIVNQKGTELPSTGGIGTTIFYVVGAILVIGAGVILITRRRMDA